MSPRALKFYAYSVRSLCVWCLVGRRMFDPVAHGKEAGARLSSKEYQSHREKLKLQKKAQNSALGCIGGVSVGTATFEDKSVASACPPRCSLIPCGLCWCRMRQMKAAKMHRSLVAAVKLGEKVAAQERAETDKMDALLASVGLSRQGLATGDAAVSIAPRPPGQ